ncbi:response regulator transcription factor [Ideonella azotifigens]|uniref:Response regulator transcription factor n=1 Tax=Ideonella azotifigens TaxID=513160 RepID=A0ABN1KB04_9BURK|nr:response regulator transcription factor [Ideonella azotifigens]MCD2344115.1 response regulator transcription factor [Ideonella azotifigens]
MPTQAPVAVKVLLADDHALFREGLKLLFTRDAGFQVVGEAQDLLGLRDLLRLTQPDLLLIDYHMPGGDSSAVVNHLKHTQPGLRIVFLTGSSAGRVLKQLADAQADGVLLKDSSAADLLANLRAVMQGQRVIPAAVAALMAPGEGLLTRREMQVVKLIGDGLSNAEMGELLSLSPKTVDKHRENLMRKLEVNSVAQLVLKAHALGWLTS